MGSFEEKLTRRFKCERLSFTTQFKIEFLLPFTGCRKVLGKMPANMVAKILQNNVYILVIGRALLLLI